MRKIFICAVAAMLFLVTPYVSLAKVSIPDNELDAITAQEGVTISFGGTSYTSGTILVTNWAPSVFSWGDGNGFAGYTSAGWVGLSGITMDAAANIILYNTMTLDVGSSGSVTKLNLGLPSALIHPVETNASVVLATAQTLATNAQVLGTLYNDKFAVIVNPLSPTVSGNITISRHTSTSTQGVEMAYSNVYLGIPSEAIIMSWGDADGFTGYASAGYMGLKSFLVLNSAMGASSMMLISLSGTSSIDIGTSAGVTAMNVVLPTTTINATAPLFGGTANITAPLAVGNTKSFSDGQELLGTLYVQGMSPTIAGSFTMTSH